MRIKSDTIISLTDADFREVVASSLDRNVLYCPNGGVCVDDISEGKNGRWDITFHLKRESEK